MPCTAPIITGKRYISRDTLALMCHMFKASVAAGATT